MEIGTFKKIKYFRAFLFSKKYKFQYSLSQRNNKFKEVQHVFNEQNTKFVFVFVWRLVFRLNR